MPISKPNCKLQWWDPLELQTSLFHPQWQHEKMGERKLTCNSDYFNSNSKHEIDISKFYFTTYLNKNALDITMSGLWESICLSKIITRQLQCALAWNCPCVFCFGLLSFLVNQSLPLIDISFKNDLHEFLPPCILTCRGPYAFINCFLRECWSIPVLSIVRTFCHVQDFSHPRQVRNSVTASLPPSQLDSNYFCFASGTCYGQKKLTADVQTVNSEWLVKLSL